MTTFGGRFREARLACGLTQRDIAKVLDIRENDVRRWETDRNLPASYRLPEIAEVLAVSIDYLFGFEAPKESPVAVAKRKASNGDGGKRKRRADRTFSINEDPESTPVALAA